MLSTVTETNSLFPVTFYKSVQVSWCSKPQLSFSRVHNQEVENYQFQLNSAVVNQPYRSETSNINDRETFHLFKNTEGKEDASSKSACPSVLE